MFLARSTGLKAHQIKQDDIKLIPESHLPFVRRLGPLALKEDHHYELEYNRRIHTFVNGVKLADNIMYSGFIDK